MKKVTSIPARPSTCPQTGAGQPQGLGAAPALGTGHLPGERDRLRLGLDVGPRLGRTKLWGAGDQPCCIAGAGADGHAGAAMESWAAGRVGGAPGKRVRDSQGWRCPQDTDNRF